MPDFRQVIAHIGHLVKIINTDNFDDVTQNDHKNGQHVF